MRLDWIRHPTGRWSRFAFIDPDLANTVGVFVIWQEGRNSTVYVGQGNVRDEIVRLREEQRVGRSDALLIAWARVSSAETRDGVERWLAEILKPEIQVPRSSRAPLRANTPHT